MKKKAVNSNPIREGKEDGGIGKNIPESNKEAYPGKTIKDKQSDNQPEFIDRDSNKKEKDQWKK